MISQNKSSIRTLIKAYEKANLVIRMTKESTESILSIRWSLFRYVSIGHCLMNSVQSLDSNIRVRPCNRHHVSFV